MLQPDKGMLQLYDTVLILDFGSQLTQLIARRIREAKVYSEVRSFHGASDWLSKWSIDNPHNPLKGIILSGSPDSVLSCQSEQEKETLQAVFSLKLPVLGICYGMQAMAHFFGGLIFHGKQNIRHKNGEFGAATIAFAPNTALFKNINTSQHINKINVWMSHRDQVCKLPDNFSCIANTKQCPIAGIANESQHLYGLQFHPEVTHTEHGNIILTSFVLDICGAKANWAMQDNHVDNIVQNIRLQVGNERVILGISGGVDSSVAAVLINKAIGAQLVCLFVDHGMLRLNEAKMVMDMLTQELQLCVIHIDASQIFLKALKGIKDPEKKRKIIGNLFIDVFKKEAKKLSNNQKKPIKFLAQGTIYPDVIESGEIKNQFHKHHKISKTATIKSHHNVGGLPEKLGLKLLEPLRHLFKDEVRQIGLKLGLPAAMIHRHPFPGPGLSVRILGEVKIKYINLLQQADNIFIEELRNFYDNKNEKNWYEMTDQAFAVFLPIKSVGVMGDARVYDYVIALRAVQTSDFMTAHWAKLPYELLQSVASRIMNEVSGISRVTYDISSKPPSTIEWE